MECAGSDCDVSGAESDCDVSGDESGMEELEERESYESLCKVYDISAVRRWNEYIGRINHIGPEGITLANTNPYNIHNPNLTAMYDDVKANYDRLLGVPETGWEANVNKEDNEVLRLYCIGHYVAGYTFFPYLTGSAKRVFSNPIYPIMYPSGGFKIGYDHFLPALILQTIIPHVYSKNIDLHIICRGTDRLFFSNENLEDLMVSEAFINASTTLLQIKRTRRICIWIRTIRHLYAIVWDTLVDGDGDVRHRCFMCNSAEDAKSREVLDNFVSLLNDRGYDSIQKFYNILDHTVIRCTDKGMMCVSLMTRATLYLSMVDDVLSHRELIRQKVSYLGNGNNFEAFVYRCFEINLYKFVKEQTDKGHIVLFSHKNTGHFYINANDVKLVVLMNPSDTSTLGVNYLGIRKGFQVEGGGGDYDGGGCQTQAHFMGLPSDFREC